MNWGYIGTASSDERENEDRYIKEYLKGFEKEFESIQGYVHVDFHYPLGDKRRHSFSASNGDIVYLLEQIAQSKQNHTGNRSGS